MPARLNDLVATLVATAAALALYVLVVWLIEDLPFFGGELPVRLIAASIVTPALAYALARVLRRTVRRELGAPRLGV